MGSSPAGSTNTDLPWRWSPSRRGFRWRTDQACSRTAPTHLSEGGLNLLATSWGGTDLQRDTHAMFVPDKDEHFPHPRQWL